MKKEHLIFILIAYFIIIVFAVKDTNSEEIIWKFNNNPTIKKCMKESKQSKMVCEKIIRLIKKSKYKVTISKGFFEQEF